MIKIRVNKKTIEIEEDFNVTQLLHKINSPKNGIAVAINDNIVSKDDWELQTFLDNDNILIIQATQGG